MIQIPGDRNSQTMKTVSLKHTEETAKYVI